MDDLQQLEQWAEPLWRSLEPAARRTLAMKIGRALRGSQAARIGRQENPDGSRYEKRKRQPPARGKRGRIKRGAMFVKLRQAKFLRMTANENEIAVGYTARVARIARVHQEGRIDAVRPGGARVRYAQRALLGFTQSDRDLVRDLLLEHLAGV